MTNQSIDVRISIDEWYMGNAYVSPCYPFEKENGEIVGTISEIFNLLPGQSGKFKLIKVDE